MEKTTEQITQEIKEDLKEAAHWFGWEELRRVIDELEEKEKEKAFERYYDPERQ